MKLVIISDTHMQAHKLPLPAGDVLIHCGDLSNFGTQMDWESECKWLDQSYGDQFECIIVIPGNHDLFVQENPQMARLVAHDAGLVLLIDEAYVYEGVHFYGSPWQPWFLDWAFNFKRRDDGSQARKTWAKIPDDTEVLITHGPPRGILDDTNPGDERVGDVYLRQRIGRLEKLKLHCFGHIHESFGEAVFEAEDGKHITFINACICDRPKYAAIQPPHTYELTNDPPAGAALSLAA